MITSMKSKRIKKENNLKTQNLITSAQNRVLNNTKIYQPKVEMHKKYFKKNPPKMKKRNAREKERETTFLCVANGREKKREITFCV